MQKLTSAFTALIVVAAMMAAAIFAGSAAVLLATGRGFLMSSPNITSTASASPTPQVPGGAARVVAQSRDPLVTSAN
jgi:hypothetical protein